jgi:hypothetical protein
MTLIETLEYFIDDVKQRCDDIKWEIDNTNDQSYLNDFKEEYLEYKQRLEDLKKIKSIVENYND